MKKTLIALAAVAATSAAFAQSSVTIYGKVEAGFQKMNGASLKMTNIHGSRLGFKGSEDLGGGLKANFGFEHRFDPDTGANNPAAAVSADGTTAAVTMWNGFSYVGLSGGFGELKLGRFYSAAFLGANNKADPFGGDGAGGLRGVGMLTTYVRTANILHYSGSFSGVNVALSTGLKEGAAKAHNSFAVSYANGPLDVGVGQEKGADAGTLTNAYVAYDLGVAKLSFGLGNKETGAGVKSEGMLLGASIPAGPGRVMVGLATAKNKTTGVKTNQKMGLGYFYPLSKRTSLDMTYGHDSKAKTADGKNVGGFDLTLQHNF